MAERPQRGFDRGLTDYGDRDFARYLRRSFARSMDYSEEMLARPIVGTCYTSAGFNNSHRNFPGSRRRDAGDLPYRSSRLPNKDPGAH